MWSKKILCWAITLVFIGVPLFGQGQKNYVVEGNKFYDKGEFEKALKQYEFAISKGQNIPFAWFNLGNCHAQKKRYSQAIVAYKRSIENAPQYARPWLVLGDIYTIYGAVGEAVKCYKRAVELEPEDSYAWKWLGENALKAGDVTEAMKAFETALNIDPDLVDIYFALAETYAKIRDFESAINVLKKAILLSPSVDENVYNYLGHLYEQNDEVKKAIRAYEEGLSFNEKNVTMYLRIAKLQVQQGAEYLALLTLDNASKKNQKNSDIYLEMGSIYFKQERLEKSLEVFEKAFQLGNPRGRTGVENVSAVYWNLGDKVKAKEILLRLQ